MPSNETLLEEWRPVVGWEGLYEVSNQGRVRSLARIVYRMRYGKQELIPVRARILKVRVKSSGHLEVKLSKDGRGRGRIFHVHRLVLTAFVGECPLGMECLHANDVAADNRLQNLSWGSRTENQLDLVRNGRHHNSRLTHCLRGHEFTPANTRVLLRKGQPRRVCRACSRIRTDKSVQRRQSLKAVV